MKKILFACCLALLLSACADHGIHDSYAAYRDKTAAQLYHVATQDIHDGHYNRAIKQLEALNALYPFGVYSEQGLINLVYTYYENDNADEALATADRYLRLYPRGHYADYADYMKGVIAFKQGFSWLQRRVGINPAPRDLTNFKQAYLSFNALIENSPHSPYAPDAIARMRYIRNLFAEKELGIAQFYFEHHAYVAAANRANDVVVHFNGAPSVIPALKIMIASYHQLGLSDMANNTQKILDASYHQ